MREKRKRQRFRRLSGSGNQGLFVEIGLGGKTRHSKEATGFLGGGQAGMAGANREVSRQLAEQAMELLQGLTHEAVIAGHKVSPSPGPIKEGVARQQGQGLLVFSFMTEDKKTGRAHGMAGGVDNLEAVLSIQGQAIPVLKAGVGMGEGAGSAKELGGIDGRIIQHADVSSMHKEGPLGHSFLPGIQGSDMVIVGVGGQNHPDGQIRR